MRIWKFAIGALLAGLAVSPALATTLVRLSGEQLTQASSIIVRGRLVSQESQWNADHTRVYTYSTFAVESALKGNPGSAVTVRQPGGTVGDIHVKVAGTVWFFPEVSYILFLEPAGEADSQFLLVGMLQGAYRIYRDAASQKEWLAHPLGGYFFAPGAGEANGISPASQAMPLNQFRQRLEAALQTPLSIPRGTAIPVVIRSTEFAGAGRLRVAGRTLLEVFPNSKTVIPAGSAVEGTAELVSGTWRIRWLQVSLRGTTVEIHAESEEPAGGSLLGREVIAQVR